ncbi:RluA family pseudouridine synthase [Chloroflexota bacterium]
MKIDLLFEDEDILIINKPPGLSAIAEGWQPESPNLIKLLSNIHGRLWVVHRLDKNTSGVMVCAKNAESHRSLNIQFEKRQVNKHYHAILEGVPEWKFAIADQSLRINSGRSHRTVVDTIHGKAASSSFKILKTIKHYSTVEVSPITGRTHQVRVHSANLGFPILGDLLYGGHKNKYIDRMALHAQLISFSHPRTNHLMEITAPYPSDFAFSLFVLGFDNLASY